MTSIPLTDLLTLIFVLVDDWYQAKGASLLKGKPGAKPEFTDTVIGLITRVIAKVTSHVLRHILWVDFGVNVQTFEVSRPS